MDKKTKVGFMATEAENEMITMVRKLNGHSVTTDWLRAITLEAAARALRGKIRTLKARGAEYAEFETALIEAEQWVTLSRENKKVIK